MLKDLFLLMGRVILWADSAYGAISTYYPRWNSKVQEKARRNHPLTDRQKQANRLKSKIRILIEHVIRAIKIFRCCSERVRNLRAEKHSRYWSIVAGLWNQKQAETLAITHIFN